jgi:hypothetical protein
MGLTIHLLGATPTPESVSLHFMLCNYLKATLIEVARSNLETLITFFVNFFNSSFLDNLPRNFFSRPYIKKFQIILQRLDGKSIFEKKVSKNS